MGLLGLILALIWLERGCFSWKGLVLVREQWRLMVKLCFFLFSVNLGLNEAFKTHLKTLRVSRVLHKALTGPLKALKRPWGPDKALKGLMRRLRDL